MTTPKNVIRQLIFVQVPQDSDSPGHQIGLILYKKFIEKSYNLTKPETSKMRPYGIQSDDLIFQF